MSEHTFTFTDEELQCLRVCLQNAPTPYHISKKKIVGEVEDIMGAVVYLASDASLLVTGSSLMIDGGLTTGLPQFPI